MHQENYQKSKMLIKIFLMNLKSSQINFFIFFLQILKIILCAHQLTQHFDTSKTILFFKKLKVVLEYARLISIFQYFEKPSFRTNNIFSFIFQKSSVRLKLQWSKPYFDITYQIKKNIFFLKTKLLFKNIKL